MTEAATVSFAAVAIIAGILSIPIAVYILHRRAIAFMIASNAGIEQRLAAVEARITHLDHGASAAEPGIADSHQLQLDLAAPSVSELAPLAVKRVPRRRRPVAAE